MSVEAYAHSGKEKKGEEKQAEERELIVVVVVADNKEMAIGKSLLPPPIRIRKTRNISTRKRN